MRKDERGEALLFAETDEAVIQAERRKARQLRKSRWWQQQTAKGVCWYCGRQVGHAGLTMDHVVPLARGGRSTRSNLVPCCKDCNTRKKTSLPLEWEEYMAALDGRCG